MFYYSIVKNQVNNDKLFLIMFVIYFKLQCWIELLRCLTIEQLALTKRKEVYTDMFYGLIMTEMLKNSV